MLTVFSVCDTATRYTLKTFRFTAFHKSLENHSKEPGLLWQTVDSTLDLLFSNTGALGSITPPFLPFF